MMSFHDHHFKGDVKSFLTHGLTNMWNRPYQSGSSAASSIRILSASRYILIRSAWSITLRALSTSLE